MSTATIHRTNAELQRDVEQELTWDPATESASIGVSVDDRAVTLTGTVQTLRSRLAAVAATKRVRGVQTIADDIEVQLDGGPRHSDSDVAGFVEGALTWSFVTPDSVQATIRDGVATLTGAVDWNYQRRAAEHVVQNVAGVRNVVNQIALVHVETSREIHSDIATALHRAADIDAKAVTVTSDGGDVSLTGTVSSWAERERVKDAAWAARGVTAVHDHLHIR